MRKQRRSNAGIGAWDAYSLLCLFVGAVVDSASYIIPAVAAVAATVGSAAAVLVATAMLVSMLRAANPARDRARVGVDPILALRRAVYFIWCVAARIGL